MIAKLYRCRDGYFASADGGKNSLGYIEPTKEKAMKIITRNGHQNRSGDRLNLSHARLGRLTGTLRRDGSGTGGAEGEASAAGLAAAIGLDSDDVGELAGALVAMAGEDATALVEAMTAALAGGGSPDGDPVAGPMDPESTKGLGRNQLDYIAKKLANPDPVVVQLCRATGVSVRAHYIHACRMANQRAAFTKRGR